MSQGFVGGPHRADGGKRAPSDLLHAGPRTVRLERRLRALTISDSGERVVQAWLESDTYLRVSRRMPLLLAGIQLHALPAFLREHNLDVDGTLRVNEFSNAIDFSQASQRLIEVAPGRAEYVLAEGYVFLRGSGDQPSVLRVETDSDGVDVSLVSESIEPQRFFEDWRSFAGRHAYLRGQRFYASGEFIRVDPSVTLADVQLPAETRALLDRLVVEFPQQVELLRQRRLPAKRGVLLAGPPGTGKSLYCRALCSAIDCTFIWVTSRHVREDGEAIANIWNLARMLSPTVLVLEDIDVYTEDRDEWRSSNLLGELMHQMDGVDDNSGILTLATTNRLELVERALRNRPGRFDRVVEFGPLDAASRAAMLGSLLGDSVDAETLEQLVEQTEEYTGAMVVELVTGLVSNTVKAARPSVGGVSPDRRGDTNVCRTKIGFVGAAVLHRTKR